MYGRLVAYPVNLVWVLAAVPSHVLLANIHTVDTQRLVHVRRDLLRGSLLFEYVCGAQRSNTHDVRHVGKIKHVLTIVFILSLLLFIELLPILINVRLQTVVEYV